MDNCDICGCSWVFTRTVKRHGRIFRRPNGGLYRFCSNYRNHPKK